MPPRPNPLARSKYAANRLSAVYIGSGQPPTPPSNINTPPSGESSTIPDLPEPPSPGASSSGSGLPSPPATNSTGSGSTGDPQSIAIRERPLSFNSSSSGGSGNVGLRDLTFNSMFKGGNSRTLHRSTSSISTTTSERIDEGGADIDDEDDNNDNDSHTNDDDTARLDLRFPRATESNENLLALQRVKNLTQRNRMALDKLSSYPRSDTRSPAPSHTSSSASGSSHTSSRLSRRPLSSHAPPEPQLSGSETERESTSFHSTSNSNSNSTSSIHMHSNSSQTHLRTVSQHQPRTQTPPTPHRIRTRLPSAPTSPLKALSRGNNTNHTTSSTSSNGSSPSRARKRVSIAVMDERERDIYGPGGAVRARSSLALVSRDEDRDRDRSDVTQAAMAAVASSRRRNSPSAARRRGALPLEFRAGLGQNRISNEPEPMTPYKANHNSNAHNRNNTHTYITPLSASTSTSSSSFSNTPASTSSSSSFANTSASGSGSNNLTRSATVREHHGQPKWASEDLGGPPSASASSSASFVSGGSRHQERGGDYSRDRRESVMGMGEYRERRQSLRAGSAESALVHGSGGRSFFAEGLRAAGLSPSKTKPGRAALARHGGGGGSGGGDVFTREPHDFHDDDADGRMGRTRAGTLIGTRTPAGGGQTARAMTSMADYRYLGRRDIDDDEDDVGVGTGRELRGSKSAYPLREGATTRDLQKQRERETSLTRERERELSLTRDREKDIDRAPSSMSRYTSTRAPQERYSSPFGTKRYNSTVGPGAVVQPQTPTQEHTRLMMESLTMFEGHLMRLGLGGGGSGGGTNELMRNAQSIVGAAEKLNSMLRYGVSCALDEQVDAEVEDGEGRAGAKEVADVWRRVGGEYREGQRVSDELVRGLTGFLLSMGKVVRDLAGNGGEGHMRSVSLDEEGLGLSGRRARGSMSPDVPPPGGSGAGGSIGGGGSTGGGSGSGRRSVESRRSWDPAGEALRDDTTRRLSARAESALGGARPPSSFNTLRDQYRSTPPPPANQQTGPRNSNNQSTRRLFTPREKREQQLDAQYANTNMNQADLSYADYEPSPTPAPRNQKQTTLDRSRTLPPLSLPKPLPTLPSESLRRSQTSASKAMPPPTTIRTHDRRKVSVTSVSTVRANTATFPASLTTPSSATTALTAHTVSTSHTPDRTAFPTLTRNDSEKYARSTVTFSRPSTISISALNGLQQQHLEHQRKRAGSGASSGAEPSTSVPPKAHMMSGSETEKDARRKTLGARTPRASLDSAMEASGSASKTSTVHAADRSAAVALGVGSGGMMPPMNTARRERRRTVTDIWPRE